MSNTAKRVIKNTGWLYVKMGITMFISLYTTRLILNGLGASDFGIFNIVGGAISMLGFLNSTMAAATQRFMNYSEGQGNIEKKTVVFNVSYFLHLAISLVVALLLVCGGFVFFNGVLNIPDDRMTAAYVVYGSLIISTVFTVMSVPYDAVLNSHENMRYYAFVGVIESLLKLSVAYTCVYTTSDKLIVYGILMACIPITTRLIMRIYCHKHYLECTVSFKKYYDKTTMKEMTNFAGWNFLGSSSSMIGNYGNGLVMNHFWGTTLNAAMGIAGQLDGMLHTLTNNMLKALNPVITKTEGAGQREKMLNMVLSGSKLSFLIYSIICVPFFIEMPYILKVWLKNVPDWAIVFAQLQLLKTLTEQLTITFGVAINAEGRIKGTNLVGMILNIVPICINIILFYYGYSPILLYVVNITIFGIFGVGSKVYFIHKNCGMEYKIVIRNLFCPLISITLIIVSIGYAIHNHFPNGITRLIAITLITVILHIILSYFILLTKQEKQAIKSIKLRMRI